MLADPSHMSSLVKSPPMAESSLLAASGTFACGEWSRSAAFKREATAGRTVLKYLCSALDPLPRDPDLRWDGINPAERMPGRLDQSSSVEAVHPRSGISRNCPIAR